ncbi:MAG: plasmid mobilization protein [Vicinamibacteria bacterium]
MVHLERAVGFRVTKKEYAAIEEAAEKNGMIVSRWIREVCVQAAKSGARFETHLVYSKPRDRAGDKDRKRQ